MRPGAMTRHELLGRALVTSLLASLPFFALWLATTQGWFVVPGFGLPRTAPVPLAVTLLAPLAGLGLFLADVLATSRLERWARAYDERRERRALAQAEAASSPGADRDASIPTVAAPNIMHAEMARVAATHLETERRLGRGRGRDLGGARKILLRSGPVMALAFVLAVVATEEAVRAAAVVLLQKIPHLGVVGAVGIANVVYGLFHRAYGAWAVPAKVLDGVAYSGLYLASGSLLAPIVAHVTFNLLVRRLLRAAA